MSFKNNFVSKIDGRDFAQILSGFMSTEQLFDIALLDVKRQIQMTM